MTSPQSRTDNSIRNSMFALFSRFASILAMFACRTVFIRLMGADYLGVSGLFSNILSVLSLSELGFETAILSTMYRPMANGDTEHVRALLQLFAKAYRIIGSLVLLTGLCVLPFLGLFMKETPNIPHLQLVFLLYLADSVASYYLSYREVVIDAAQQSWMIHRQEMIFELLKNVFQIIILFLTHNFILYLCLQLLFGVLRNISLWRLAGKTFPFVRSREKASMSPDKRREVKKNVLAMVTHQIGDVLVNSTDSILISTFVGVGWMGIYSNYILLSQTIHSILVQLFTAITSSVGNLAATESTDKQYDVFRILFFLNGWLYGFSAICLLVLFDPFITLWAGEGYLLPRLAVVFVALNFLFTGMRKTAIIFRNTHGLFWNDRFNPIAEATINLGAALLLVNPLGLAGILIGKWISTITTCMWVEPFVLFKHGLKRPLWKYFREYGIWMVCILLGAGLTSWIGALPSLTGILDLLYKAVVCLLVPNLLFLLVFRKRHEFSFLRDLVISRIS